MQILTAFILSPPLLKLTCKHRCSWRRQCACVQGLPQDLRVQSGHALIRFRLTNVTWGGAGDGCAVTFFAFDGESSADDVGSILHDVDAHAFATPLF